MPRTGRAECLLFLRKRRFTHLMCLRNAQRGRSAQHRGNDRRDEGHLQRDAQSAQDGRVMEQAGVPLEGKACEQCVALALVEAEHDHIGNGQVHEAEEEDDVGPLPI